MTSVKSPHLAVIYTALCNASLGCSLKLHPPAHVERILKDVSTSLGTATAEGYLAALQDVCHGRVEPDRVRPGEVVRKGSRHLFKTANAPKCIKGSPGYVSQILSWRNFIGLLSPLDRLKFGFMMGDKAPAGTSPTWAKLQSMSNGDRMRRHFKPEPNAYWMWKPIQWWTPRADVEKLLRTLPSDTWADSLRDRLGLFYDPYDPSGTEAARMTNMRFLVHIPASVILARGHFRPNFAEAGGYNRFAVHRKSVLPARKQPWGRTADLGAMRSSGQLEDGLKERVTPKMEHSDFNTAFIHFDYIGQITQATGETAMDDDVAFEKTLAALQNALFPSHTADLNLMITNLPRMAP